MYATGGPITGHHDATPILIAHMSVYVIKHSDLRALGSPQCMELLNRLHNQPIR